MGDLISMTQETDRACFTTPAQILEEAAELVEEGGEWEEFDKMLILPVSTQDRSFRVTYMNSGLSASQMLAVAAILNIKALAMMGYIEEE